MRQRGSAADQGADHRARLGHPFRQHQQRRRSAHQLVAQQDRQGLRRAAHPHRPRSRLRPHGYAVMTLTLRARLAAISTIVFGLLLAALSVASYEVLSRRLDADVTRAADASSPTACTGTCVSTTTPRRSRSTQATTIRRRSSTRRRDTTRCTMRQPDASSPNRAGWRRSALHADPWRGPGVSRGSRSRSTSRPSTAACASPTA